MITQNTAPTTTRAVRAASRAEQVQTAADLLALIPIVNIPASVVSGLISLKKRDYIGAARSLAGLIPIEGEWATALKIAHNAGYIKGVAQAGARAAKAVRTTPVQRRTLMA